MSAHRVLVIEDDAAIRRALVDALRFDSYEPLEAADGAVGLELGISSECDLILLDLVLPKRGGLEILRAVRQARPTLPVIILTARGQESDRVSGLRLGADDYVVKPFSIKELLARVAAVLRRSPGRPGDVGEVVLPSGRGTADLERREVRFIDGERCDLSEREVELLRYLAANVGRAISRQELIANVWRLDPRGVETRTIDMHVARLREKLRDDPHEPAMILTVRGKGYCLGSSPGAKAE